MTPASEEVVTEYSFEHGHSRQQQLCQQQQQRGNTKLVKDQLEEQDRESCIHVLKTLTPEDYLHQTGVSRAIEEALGLVAALRPQNPLNLFAAIIRDQVKNTHPVVRQAKLLRHVYPSMADTHLCYKLDPRGKEHIHFLNADDTEKGAKEATASLYQQQFAAGNIGNIASTLNPRRGNASQLEILCEPLHHFLCVSSSGKLFAGRNNNGSGAREGGAPGRKCTGERGGGDVSRCRRGGRAEIHSEAAGYRASWREVRRFLEALCQGAGVDAECTSAAMAALEREGFGTNGRGKQAADGWTPDIGLDFSRFVAAVRAVLLLEGFEREARKAFLELVGTVDGSAPLDELLAHLFPHNNTSVEYKSLKSDDIREAIEERLDLGLRGETKVRLSAITDCVLRPPTIKGATSRECAADAPDFRSLRALF